MAWFSYSLSFLGHLLRFTTLDTAAPWWCTCVLRRPVRWNTTATASVFLWRASAINCQPLGASLAYLYWAAREKVGYSVSEILTPNCLHTKLWLILAKSTSNFMLRYWLKWIRSTPMIKGWRIFQHFSFPSIFTVFWPEYRRIHLINEEDYVIISIVCTIVQKCTTARRCILPWW